MNVESSLRLFLAAQATSQDILTWLLVAQSQQLLQEQHSRETVGFLTQTGVPVKLPYHLFEGLLNMPPVDQHDPIEREFEGAIVQVCGQEHGDTYPGIFLYRDLNYKKCEIYGPPG